MKKEYCGGQFSVRSSRDKGKWRILVMDGTLTGLEHYLLLHNKRSSDFDLAHVYDSLEDAELAIVRYLLEMP